MEEWVSPVNYQPLDIKSGFAYDSENRYPILEEGILDLTYPFELPPEDSEAKRFYDGRVDDYERYLHLTFQTYGESEVEVRNSMIDRLNLTSNSRVLEVACGTGRDSRLINNRLGVEGQLYLTDISHEMLKLAKKKLSGSGAEAKFCVSNATHLPCPNDYFDAFYSFGALGEFSDPRKFFQEVVRVCKPGARVVVGDENLPVWLRKSEFGKILSNYNKQFMAEVPFTSLPVEARKVKCEWIIGGVFYLIDFEVGEGEPFADFDFIIPGVRGGTHRTRFFGQLEGVTTETRDLAWKARERLGISMHEWLDDVIGKASRDILGSEADEMD